jgi:hypothetical protein
MTRKDFRKAAEHVKKMDGLPADTVQVTRDAYIALFKGEALFNEEWFRQACQPDPKN